MGNIQGGIDHTTEELATGIFVYLSSLRLQTVADAILDAEDPQKPNIDKYIHLNTLRFNSKVHSSTIKIVHDGRRAKRTKGGYGVCFSRRSVSADEYVYLRIIDVSSTLVGTMRFGLTRDDPSLIPIDDLPTYCDPQNNDEGRCCRSIPELYVQKDNVLFFYYSAYDARVMYGVNDKELGVFFSTSGIGITGEQDQDSVWIMIDLVGQTVAVEFVDAVPVGNLARTPSLPQLNQQSSLPSGDQLFRRNQSFGKSTIVQRASGTRALDDVFLPSTQMRSASAHPYATSFHSALYGRNVSLSTDKQIATRRMGEYCNGYVFSSLCLRSGERWSVTVLDIAKEYDGGLAFGMTSCNPTELSQLSLPDDSDQLLNRPEYWVVHKDMYLKSERGDVLTFHLTPDGEVRYLRNGHSVGTLMYVDNSLPLWAFIDVYGSTSMIRNLGVVSVDQAMRGSGLSGASDVVSEIQRDIRRLSLTEPAGGGGSPAASIPGLVFHPHVSAPSLNPSQQQQQLRQQIKAQQKLERQQLKQQHKLEKKQEKQLKNEGTPSSSSPTIVGTAALTTPHLQKQLQPQHLPHCPRHPNASASPQIRLTLHSYHHHPSLRGAEVMGQGYRMGASSASLSSPSSSTSLSSTGSRVTQSALDSALFDVPTATPFLPPPLIPVPAASNTPPKSPSPAAPPNLTPAPSPSIPPVAGIPAPPAVPPRRSQPSGPQPPIPRRKSEVLSEGQGSLVLGSPGAREFEGPIDECSVCMERAPDCVLYTCGHMCMCFECAMGVVARSGECPICRNRIQDVIKIFRS